MGKIKKQTPDQKKTHDIAVKLRKMTDEQLVERLAATQQNAVEESSPNMVEDFLRELEAENIRGIGKVTIKKISEFAKTKGYI